MPQIAPFTTELILVLGAASNPASVKSSFGPKSVPGLNVVLTAFAVVIMAQTASPTACPSNAPAWLSTGK